jgi:hypothetical protein
VTKSESSAAKATICEYIANNDYILTYVQEDNPQGAFSELKGLKIERYMYF